MAAPLFLTLGHGKRSIGEAIDLLEQHGVRYVVDVRSAPYSRYQPDFSRDALARHLREHDIRYVFMGQELGGRPDDPTCYDAEGRVDYEACKRRPAFRQGVARLQRAWDQGQQLALLCSEARPENCHRAKLVGVALAEESIEIIHLDEDGTPLSQQEVMDRLSGGQLTLFDDLSAPQATRSRGRYRREDD